MICVYPDRGPVNEDVFAAPTVAEGKAVDSDIQEITEQIHRLLLQVPKLKKTMYYSLRNSDQILLQKMFSNF